MARSVPMKSTLLAGAVLAAMIAGAQAQDPSLVIAATTSVEDSGLFDHILPAFTAKTGIAVRIVSRASATALLTAERGTIDLVIVNAAEALDPFAAAARPAPPPPPPARRAPPPPPPPPPHPISLSFPRRGRRGPPPARHQGHD